MCRPARSVEGDREEEVVVVVGGGCGEKQSRARVKLRADFVHMRMVKARIETAVLH